MQVMEQDSPDANGLSEEQLPQSIPAIIGMAHGQQGHDLIEEDSRLQVGPQQSLMRSRPQWCSLDGQEGLYTGGEKHFMGMREITSVCQCHSDFAHRPYSQRLTA